MDSKTAIESKKHPKFIGPVKFPPILTNEARNRQTKVKQPKGQTEGQVGGNISNYIFNPLDNKLYLLNSLKGKKTLKSYIKLFKIGRKYT